MAVENGEMQEHEKRQVPKQGLTYVLLRCIALFATAGAAFVMALSKQTKTLAVGPPNHPIYATITAEFNPIPAFVFFVMANAAAALYNLLTLLIPLGDRAGLYGGKFNSKVFELVIAISDMAMANLVATGSGATVGIAKLGGKKPPGCSMNADAFNIVKKKDLVAVCGSLIGMSLMVALNVLYTLSLYKNQVKYT